MADRRNKIWTVTRWVSRIWNAIDQKSGMLDSIDERRVIAFAIGVDALPVN